MTHRRERVAEVPLYLVVASVYRRSMAPVGVLMGVSGYLIGIYGALLCPWLLSLVAGALSFR